MTIELAGDRPVKVAVLSATVAVTVTFSETLQVLNGGISDGGVQDTASVLSEVVSIEMKTRKR